MKLNWLFIPLKILLNFIYIIIFLLNPLTDCVYASNNTGNYPYCIYKGSIKDPNDIVAISEYFDCYCSFSNAWIKFPYIEETINLMS